ncbi:uracil-DNA glycosylase [Ignavigranum ruoffiae]|uniref:uracil-DNA glycosylase n=1 Tax=Ignavigranum ruoffiae TaxID=89093 RepID=UPI00206C0498|nr:uracil-DNA glycosylase [Ignavigranum ruoffiae]UPQ85487.1 uracil-DNA glycosylase [Ignavigranum ruoffiae]
MWKDALADYFNSEDYQRLKASLDDEYELEEVYPPRAEISRALMLTPLEQVKVVILGQDPYHGTHQANGLAFSVNSGIDLPPSLRNIYKELSDDLGHELVADGDLTCWAQQGVLLLNRVLTVRAGQANSHSQIGWQSFTDAVIRLLVNQERPLVFILWGKQAQSIIPLIPNHHCIIQSPHPSPLSAYRGFFGSRPFSRANHFLAAQGISPIDWLCIHQGHLNQKESV